MWRLHPRFNLLKSLRSCRRRHIDSSVPHNPYRMFVSSAITNFRRYGHRHRKTMQGFLSRTCQSRRGANRFRQLNNPSIFKAFASFAHLQQQAAALHQQGISLRCNFLDISQKCVGNLDGGFHTACHIKQHGTPSKSDVTASQHPPIPVPSAQTSLHCAAVPSAARIPCRGREFRGC
jgi:hypothetical protein